MSEPNSSPSQPADAVRAVIDVGTNSVKLLVARVVGGTVHPLDETSHTTRLGKGFYPDRILQPAAIQATAECIAEFARRAREQGAAQLRVVATSAAREAFNAAELVTAVRNTSGLELEIISGAQEAEWVFQGVMSGQGDGAKPALVMDLGGGSTEFIVGHGATLDFRESFQLGVVRLSEALQLSDPPGAVAEADCVRSVRSFLAEQVEPSLRKHLPGGRLPTRLIGVGGTATVLAAMQQGLTVFDRDKLEGAELSAERVAWWSEHLWSLPLMERQRVPGLPPKRADVIITGTAIYVAVMRQFGFASLRVSTRGLRYAAIA
jgi:exopolyphosphatase/guanosine-5'-triphosphate,3'-diphosphate pyrophosphatase